MTNKAFVLILLLTLLLGGVTGFFIHKSYFTGKTTPQIESEINKAEILRDDSMKKNTKTIRDSLAKSLEKLHELE